MCYWLGDATSKVLELFGDNESWATFWYPIYNNLMLWSRKIQNKYDNDGPWEHGQEE